jgi:hypothetical protein
MMQRKQWKAPKGKTAEKEPAATQQPADGPTAARMRAATRPGAASYEEKLAEVRRDLDTLIAKLRTHGIHLGLDPKEDDGGEG